MTDAIHITIDPDRFRRLRGEHTQKQFAAVIGVSVASLSNYERGVTNPSAITLLVALAVTGVDAIELLSTEDANAINGCDAAAEFRRI